jgi:hypothetical protein
MNAGAIYAFLTAVGFIPMIWFLASILEAFSLAVIPIYVFIRSML